MAAISQQLPSAPHPHRIISSLSWAHFLNHGMVNYLPGVLPFILAARHIPEALAGTFITALLLGQGLQPISGIIADRIGGRILVLGGVALSTTTVVVDRNHRGSEDESLWGCDAELTCSLSGRTRRPARRPRTPKLVAMASEAFAQLRNTTSDTLANAARVRRMVIILRRRSFQTLRASPECGIGTH